MRKFVRSAFAGVSLLAFASSSLAQQVNVEASASLPVVAASLPTGPSASCDKDAIQALAPGDTTVSIAASEGGVCRVTGYVTTQNPGPNRVGFVLALPGNFNGRYLFLGVGGAAGSLPRLKPSLLAKGYVLAGTDAGTGAKSGADFSFKSDPAKLTDFQWRGVQTSAVATQQITRGYYKRDKIGRYINGCSGGGQMGMSNAVRFGAQNFDGFITAATVWPGSAFKPNVYRIMAHMQNHPEGWLPPELLKRAHAAIIARYDDTDGAHDGMIADARNIKNFDLDILRQVGFTPAQIETFQMITTPPKPYSGPGIYKDGMQAGWPVTDLAGWVGMLTGTSPPPWPNTVTASTEALQAKGVPFFHMMADSNFRAQRPGLDYSTVTDVNEMVSIATLGGTEVSTSDLDFSKVAASGAKMIIYHGTADQANSYLDNVRGYEEVLAKNPTAKNWLRFFTVPGMQHCGGGNGPSDVEDPMIEALATWVETGRAPESVLAARTVPGKGVDRVFRLCPEPRRAVLKSPELDFNKSENWECRLPRK